MQHLIYRMKSLLRAKSLLFWSLAFPLILGMLFYFMFGNIADTELFSEVSIGIVHGDKNPQFVKIISEVETGDGISMFRVKEYEEEEEAAKALEEHKITGYVDVTDDLKLTVTDSNESSSVIKTFLDQYKQNESLIVGIGSRHPEQIGAIVEAMSGGQGVALQEIPLKGTEKDPYAQYFYALIAMVCLIGTMTGLNNGIDIQADLTMVGARRNIAPMPKMRQVLTDFLAAYILYCVLVTIVLAACVFVYQQDFGNDVALILLGGWVGSFTGIAIGTMIAVLVKGSRDKKEGICVAVFMGSSFLGGLQWGEITYVLEKNCPVVNRINPATLIVNAFKSLSVFGDYRQYAVNMATLLVIGVLCFIISISRLRRMRYASL